MKNQNVFDPKRKTWKLIIHDIREPILFKKWDSEQDTLIVFEQIEVFKLEKQVFNLLSTKDKPCDQTVMALKKLAQRFEQWKILKRK